MDGKDVVANLEAWHAVTLEADQRSDYGWFFDQRKDRAEDILRRWKFQNPPKSKFPSLAELSTVDIDLSTEEHEEKKRTAPRYEDLAKAKSPHGRQIIQEMIARVSTMGMDRGAYLDWMRKKGFETESRAVAELWYQCANELEQFWKMEFERHKISAEVLEHQSAFHENRPENTDISCECLHCRRYLEGINNQQETNTNE